ncbi:glycine dehydrogenase subunit 1 [Planctomicrobium piriforme]|uniref:glycine dehydrogenase (aminomethyl-transferring) n=2 Tax=Planctomicrobium piriforme TaxID=1576369 RepID=A0A1I3J7U9_9PLAN|nr:glycine dehydrogenase subunit 1 [Planctomicrobium piriforme]
MLREIGVSSMETLLRQVPDELRLKRDLALPPAMTEMELEQHVRKLAAMNDADRVCFLGGGAYDHFIPAVVDEVTGRGEFYTAYTPYQPEASQGSLQAFFEFQTLICELTGMDVSNASLYEGGTAVSEATFMAMRVNGRESKVAISGGVHPEYRLVVETYLRDLGTEVVTLPVLNGKTDMARAAELIDDKTACLVFQHPNFFGCLEEADALCKLAHSAGALSVASFDPLSLGVLRRPGDYGADIAVAEGQSLGVPLQYGGPYLGLLACQQEFVRKMPGRLITKTIDRDGKECYALGLQTREQHIRRDKATSNICTNQGLLALRATVYMSLLGPQGIREAGELACQKAHYAAKQLCTVPGISLMFDAPFFKEFVLKVTGRSAQQVIKQASAAGFDIGPELSIFPNLTGDASTGLLVAVTESRTKSEIDQLVAALKK